MREKELRLALVCYGGISLAVYMHGITKEVWRLARASRALHGGGTPAAGVEAVYHRLLGQIGAAADLRLRVLADVLSGASAGGINAIFLAHAVATGRSLEPLTALWLDVADVERLLDPGARPASRLSKLWAQPLVWAAARRGGLDDVDAPVRDEVAAKLSALLRGRWFEPPFGGAGFTALLLDALAAMDATPAGPPLLPDGHPLDLSVTLTDFNGHAERLAIHSPAEVLETEHRVVAAFRDRGVAPRQLAHPAELAFAARATASFPGAFPPFTVAELDGVLADRGQAWPGRDAFLSRVLPDHAAIGRAGDAVLIDGSVLANAPFRPAIAALAERPARREIDRRIVYVDPKPDHGSFRLTDGGGRVPGFFATILGALSDLPRSQPIRDNLEAIERRSARVAQLRQVVDGIRPEVEAAIERSFGQPLFLSRPTPARLAAWRARAHDAAAKAAGYAYAAYARLKLAGIATETAGLLHTLGDARGHGARAALREAVERVAPPADEAALKQHFRIHDLGFRIRRLRLVARRLTELEDRRAPGEARADGVRAAVFRALGLYLERQRPGFFDAEVVALARGARRAPAEALAVIGAARDLRAVDDAADAILAEALAAMPKPERRELLLAYLGFPFYDIATFPLLHGEGLDEFDPVKVDRIAPDDCGAIRQGGAEATLKGIRFNSFGAFFSRAWRENDYLWGRLHGAERMVDILASTVPDGSPLPPGLVATAKRDLFRAILAEERARLTAVPDLIDQLAREVG